MAASTTPSPRSKRKPTPSLLEQLTFEAIGTRWQIDTQRALAPDVIRAIHDRAEAFDRVWSRFRGDSVVSHISRHPGRHKLPPEATELFALYKKLYVATRGAVTPLIGRALEEWGYDRDYRLQPAKTITPVPRWEDALAFADGAITTTGSQVIDVGAAGKGYLVDLIGAVLVHHGIAEFTIDASGDLLHRSHPETAGQPLRVALEHPLNPALAVGVAQLVNGALCASAANRRSWPGAHHIIDALTGRPTDTIIATWAIAETCLLADGLATALFFTTGAELAKSNRFEFVRMFRTGRLEQSSNFPGEIFS